ncbi:MAG: helix-turn-helix domain-containing protein [Eubacteriales bacterium]|nr:helix-turn-helix domain-containing protein [Eubacteriales bacterium]
MVYLVTMNEYQNKAQESFRRAMAQSAAHVDTLVQEMQSTVGIFTANQQMTALLDRAGKDSDTLTSVMSSYLTNAQENSRIKTRMIFYRMGDTMIYSADGLMEYAAFQSELGKAVDLDRSAFFSHLNKTISLTFWPLVHDGTAGSGMMSLALPVFQASTGRQGTFVCLIDTEQLLDTITEYLGTEPVCLQIYSPSYDLLGQRQSLKMNEKENVAVQQCGINNLTTVMLAGEEYQALRYKTDLFGINLIAALRLTSLYGGMEQLQMRTMLIVGMLVLVVLIVALFMARNFYRPVGKLLHTIAENEADADGSFSEYDRIGRYLNNIHQERDELQEQLAMQRPFVRDQLLLRVIRGSLSDHDLAQLNYALPEIPLAGQPMYALLITADVDSLKNAHALEELVLEGADAHGVYVEDERFFAMLIVCHTNRDARLEHGEHLMRLLCQMNITMSGIGAGSIVNELKSVPRSYLEAYIALKNHSGSQNRPGVCLYEPEKPACGRNENWLLRGGDEAGLYLQAVHSVDQRTALEVLDTLLTRLRHELVSMLNASYMRFELFSRTMAVCEPEVVHAFREEYKSITLFAGEQAFEEMMKRLTVSNCQAVEKRRDTGRSSQQQLILNTLREHCFEPDFSLARLSELVEYSGTYINRCLRMETGYGFMQLVSSYRLAYVKQELAHTDEKIKDVVTRAGYMDIASFTRKFREAEGMTPSEYRSLNRPHGLEP